MEHTIVMKIYLMKPAILKAAIPLAISVAGFIFAGITLRNKPAISRASAIQNKIDVPKKDSEDTHYQNSPENSTIEDEFEPETEIFRLKNRAKALEEREYEIETRFLSYQSLKERETMLTELKNNLLMEISGIEYLGREIKIMEECLKLLDQLGLSKLENGLLRRRIKKLLRKIKRNYRVINDQKLQIEARQTEDSRNREELERRGERIKELEEEIGQAQMNMQRFQEEKDEISDKMEVTEKSVSLKIEAVVEDYDRLQNELEKIQKDRSMEAEELIYLRWCNACLRHDLNRRDDQEHEEQKQVKEKDNLSEPDLGEIEGLTMAINGNVDSKKRRFVHKVRRWMEGKEKTCVLPVGKSCSSRK